MKTIFEYNERDGIALRSGITEVQGTSVNLTLTEDKKVVIDTVAKNLGVTSSSFIVDAANRTAEHIILDQTLLRVDQANYDFFVQALDKNASGVGYERLLLAPKPVGVAELTPPTLLSAEHQLSYFDCGVEILDEWLKRYAHVSQNSGISKTYVVTDGLYSVGYYSLATGVIHFDLDDPFPVVILGRLAVDQAWHGKGLGTALLNDALANALQMAEYFGYRGVVAYAISSSAKTFYEHFGFTASPSQPMSLVLSLKQGGQEPLAPLELDRAVD